MSISIKDLKIGQVIDLESDYIYQVKEIDNNTNQRKYKMVNFDLKEFTKVYGIGIVDSENQLVVLPNNIKGYNGYYMNTTSNYMIGFKKQIFMEDKEDLFVFTDYNLRPISREMTWEESLKSEMLQQIKMELIGYNDKTKGIFLQDFSGNTYTEKQVNKKSNYQSYTSDTKKKHFQISEGGNTMEKVNQILNGVLDFGWLGLGEEYGINTDERIKSTLVGIALQNETDSGFQVYDSKVKTIVSYGKLEIGKFPTLIVPAIGVKEGDLVKWDNGEYFWITEVTPEEIKGIDPRNSMKQVLVPKTNFLGISVFKKLVSLDRFINLKNLKLDNKSLLAALGAINVAKVVCNNINSKENMMEELKDLIKEIAPILVVVLAGKMLDKTGNFSIKEIADTAKNKLNIEFELLKNKKDLKKIATLSGAILLTTGIVIKLKKGKKGEETIADLDTEGVVSLLRQLAEKLKPYKKMAIALVPVSLAVIGIKIQGKDISEIIDDAKIKAELGFGVAKEWISNKFNKEDLEAKGQEVVNENEILQDVLGQDGTSEE